MDGALLENGPFRMQTNGSLTMNPNRWTQVANMLYRNAFGLMILSVHTWADVVCASRSACWYRSEQCRSGTAVHGQPNAIADSVHALHGPIRTALSIHHIDAGTHCSFVVFLRYATDGHFGLALLGGRIIWRHLCFLLRHAVARTTSATNDSDSSPVSSYRHEKS